MIEKRGLEPSDRPLLAALLGSVSALSDEERAVALELVDHQLAHPGSDDYRFILGFAPAAPGERPELCGYLCYGRTPMTRSTYDLYWIATSPSFTRSGVARELLSHLEGEITGEGGGLVRVETGSREMHGAAVHFYDATGFTRAATIADFYAPGDDLIIFTKRVRGPSAPGLDEHDEPALYDAAFGYRAFAGERDFLLACARRYGAGDVRRVLAFASGPGRHVEAFADAGIAGIGTDPSAAMVAYAQRVVRRRAGGPEVRFLQAALDEPPHTDAPLPPVDLSFVPLCSVHVLATPEAMTAHLRVAADLLRPGGLHVIEAMHPADLLPSGVHHSEWTEVRGDATVDARFRMHVERITEGRVVPVTLEVVRTAGKKGAAGPAPRAARLDQEETWFIPDLEGWRAIARRVPALELVAVLGDFNVDVPFQHTAAWRLILVLRKKG